MSMREYPSSGYVVPVDALKPLLSTEQQTQLDELLESYDTEKVADFLSANLPENLPCIDSVFCPSETDTVDEPMRQDEYYAVFDEDALYVKMATPQLEALLHVGIAPEFAHWSVWG